jgi:hypothetical protein
MDYKTILDVLNSYVQILVLIVLSTNVVFCFVHRHKLNSPFRFLFYYLIWNLLIEILAITFMKIGYNNLPLLHIYTLGEFVFFSYFYKSLIHKPSAFQKFFRHYIVVGSILIILNSIFFQSIYDFNTYSKSVVQITIIGFAVLYFYNLIENKLLTEEISKGLRLVNSAILIYYSGSLFIFMYGISLEANDHYIMMWTFNAILNLVFQMLILRGLWKVYFKKRIL